MLFYTKKFLLTHGMSPKKLGASHCRQRTILQRSNGAKISYFHSYIYIIIIIIIITIIIIIITIIIINYYYYIYIYVYYIYI